MNGLHLVLLNINTKDAMLKELKKNHLIFRYIALLKINFTTYKRKSIIDEKNGIQILR